MAKKARKNRPPHWMGINADDDPINLSFLYYIKDENIFIDRNINPC